MSNIGTLPAARPSHFISLVCFVLLFCALACRGTVRLPLTLSVLRMWMWNHLHTVFVSRVFVLVISPHVHGVPDLGQIVFAKDGWRVLQKAFDSNVIHAVFVVSVLLLIHTFKCAKL